MASFAELKARARRAVHTALCISARYENYDKTVSDDLSVRWHNKQALYGDFDNAGYANVIEGNERIIFDRDELRTKGIALQEGDSITITDTGYKGAVLFLRVRIPVQGPVEEIWEVTGG